MDYKYKYLKYKNKYINLKNINNNNFKYSEVIDKSKVTSQQGGQYLYHDRQLNIGVADTFPNNQPSGQAIDPIGISPQVTTTVPQPLLPPSVNLEKFMLPTGIDLNENLQSRIQSITAL